MESVISKETISEFIAGSEKAFTQIYWAYYPVTLLLGRRVFGDHDHARDFVQDLFARVWEKREKFKDVDDITSYIYGMAWKLIADKQSKATSRSKSLQQYFAQSSQSDAVELEFEYTDNDYKHILEQALATTTPRGQKIFKLREEGLSRTQIAKHLNLAQHIVDNDLSSAVKAIKSYIRAHTISIFIALVAGYLLA